MSWIELTPANLTDNEEDFIRINKNKRKVDGKVYIFKFIDKDTKQIVFYTPSFNLSGYGATDEKAFEMIKESLADLFEHFVSIPLDELNVELSQIGWKKTLFQNKRFSRAATDINAATENLNAVEGTIQRFVLAA